MNSNPISKTLRVARIIKAISEAGYRAVAGFTAIALFNIVAPLIGINQIPAILLTMLATMGLIYIIIEHAAESQRE